LLSAWASLDHLSTNPPAGWIPTHRSRCRWCLKVWLLHTSSQPLRIVSMCTPVHSTPRRVPDYLMEIYPLQQPGSVYVPHWPTHHPIYDSAPSTMVLLTLCSLFQRLLIVQPIQVTPERSLPIRPFLWCDSTQEYFQMSESKLLPVCRTSSVYYIWARLATKPK